VNVHQRPGLSLSRAAAVSGLLASSLLISGCVGPTSPLEDYSNTVLIEALAPSVASAGPATGSVSGGDTITITGVSLDTVTEVTFGGQQATAVTVVSATELAVVVPRAAEYQVGTAPITVLVDGEPLPTETDLLFEWQLLSPVDRQLSYAFQHWDRPDYNLAGYGTFNPVGGDCANFVNQTLIARGWEMTTTWHNRNAGAQWTSSWILVQALDNWLRTNATTLGIQELSIEQRDQVKIGDIVMFDWNLNNTLDHTQIVSDVEVVDGKTVIKMVGHNTDSDWRDFDDTITVDHPGAEAYFWSVP
jgi:hypothetical protein